MRILMMLSLALYAGCSGGDDEAMPTQKTDVEKAIEGLSPADQVLARAQKDCPISGEPLGSMGTPVKVTAKGRSAFLCCEGCRKRFVADPDAAFARIDAAAK